MLLKEYNAEKFYDEMIDPKTGVRSWYKLLSERITELGMEEVLQRQYTAERAFMSMGITFNTYDEGEIIDRIFPFDIIPRIISAKEWAVVEEGLKQRIVALNLFLQDIYNEQKVIKDKIIPREIIESSPGYLKQCMGLTPPRKIWCHISGIDLIKHSDGKFYVLEDNLRVPSGVSYVLGNREIMKSTFPEVFEKLFVSPIYDYPLRLLEMLQYLSQSEKPVVGVLTPGVYNSAYFEHSFLAQQMGVRLVEGSDITVQDNKVYLRTTRGLEKVDVLYRRVDDTFLDPNHFRADSALGAKGLFDAYRSNNVALANAPGTGVADDKVIYAYVPQIIKYYLNEEPKLSNVPTYMCWDESDRRFVLDNMKHLVVKAANQSGGYGMLIGPQASSKEIEKFIQLINFTPREYIAQPVMALSTVPTLVDEHLEGRHVDLRPYILYGENVYVIPGGLTRVALRKGSLVVNSSQGGGSKDTWVLRSSGDA